MYSSIVPAHPTVANRRLELVAFLFVLLYLAGVTASDSSVSQAAWFPDQPRQTAYEWRYTPCEHCVSIAAERDWVRMQQLAGLNKVHFLKTPDNRWGDAYSFAPNALVLSEAALNLPRCQLDFIIGHELVHLAMRDFDEDAGAATVLSGLKPDWTLDGKRAISLLDGDYGLAMKMASIWQAQEQRADWVGALLAAEGAGCTIQSGALPYLTDQMGYGGGIGAAHESNVVRARFLEGFSSPAARLANRF